MDQFVTAGQAVSGGFCYYCGAPLDALHHSYCTLMKVLQPPSEKSSDYVGAPTSASSQLQYGSHGNAPNLMTQQGHGQPIYSYAATEKAYGPYGWQPDPTQWVFSDVPAGNHSWQGEEPPPPPPEAEGAPPLPSAEEGQAPWPPSEQSPPPPDDPWEVGAYSNTSSLQQGGTAREAESRGGQAEPASTFQWGTSNGSAEQWREQGWGHASGAWTNQPPPQQTAELPAPNEPLAPAVQAQHSTAVQAPWPQPNAHLQSGSASPTGGGSGMESIRDYYAATGAYLQAPQLPVPVPAVLHGGPFVRMPNHHLALSHVGSLPFPAVPTPPPVPVPEEPRQVDARELFMRPGRASRPDRFVVILRGLPGSGKSHLAKALRDVEVANGGSAPRLHTMDEYFVTEVEKEVEVDNNRGKKRKTRQTATEYLYEPELEQAYCQSMLKAFKKTLEEGRFHVVLVEYWNLVVSDFEPYWKVAKSSGYEVYVLQPAKLDPETCARRNIHGFSLEQIREMSGRWEPLPPMYLQLDIAPLFKGDLLDMGDIAEVEMDSEPEPEEEPPASTSKRPLYESDEDDDELPHHEPPPRPFARPRKGALADGESREKPEKDKGRAGKGSGKTRKVVKWADLEGEKEAAKGFRIGVDLSKKWKLEIGPGAGYTQDQTGPLAQHSAQDHAVWAKKVKAQVRDEADTFKAVLARRRQRVGLEDDFD